MGRFLLGGLKSLMWSRIGGCKREPLSNPSLPHNPTGRGLAQLIFTPSGSIGPAVVGAHEQLVSGDNAVLASIVLEVGNRFTGPEFGDIGLS